VLRAVKRNAGYFIAPRAICRSESVEEPKRENERRPVARKPRADRLRTRLDAMMTREEPRALAEVEPALITEHAADERCDDDQRQ